MHSPHYQKKSAPTNNMEYRITIRAMEPYKKTSYKYEGSDGKRYLSEYAVPQGVTATSKEFETGEVGYTERDIFSQTVDGLDIEAVIKAANKIK